MDTMTTTTDDTASDALDDAQGAFFEYKTAIVDLEPGGGPYANRGEPKALRAQCVECNRRYVRLGALRCDGCAKTIADGPRSH
jgi:hypothetical protein